MAKKKGFSLHFNDWVAAITISCTMNMNLGQLYLCKKKRKEKENMKLQNSLLFISSVYQGRVKSILKEFRVHPLNTCWNCKEITALFLAKLE